MNQSTFSRACAAVVVLAVLTTVSGHVVAAKPVIATAKKPPSAVIRTAPDFTWIGAGGKIFPGKNFRGQPVVIMIGASPDAHDVRQEAGRIAGRYLDFAAKKTIFVSAFTAGHGRVVSDVPFVPAQNGAAVAAAYGAPGKGLSIVVLGPDGNVDIVSNKVEGAQRILDMINNTYQTQAAARTGLGS